MQTRTPSGGIPTTPGRDCSLQRLQACDKHRRHRASFRVRAETSADRKSEQSPPQAHINGKGNGVSNGKALISSNNGVVLDRKGGSLEDRILSGEFSNQGSTKEKALRPVRQALAKDPVGPGNSSETPLYAIFQLARRLLCVASAVTIQFFSASLSYAHFTFIILLPKLQLVAGRRLSLWLARLGQQWRREAAARMPEASGDIREIVGQPVFVPLYKLFLTYGPVFRLSFGPKSFVVISDPALAKQVLLTNAHKYSKGLLSEILDFVMGKGLIPADGEIWKTRRRAIVPSLHRKYIASMVTMFGESTLHGMKTLDKAVLEKRPVEMENFFSRLTLDIIGKAVFNYDFDSLTHDDPFIQVGCLLYLLCACHSSAA